MKPLSLIYTWEDYCYAQLSDIFLFAEESPFRDRDPLDLLENLFSNLSFQVKSGSNINLSFNGENIYFIIASSAIEMLEKIQDPSDNAFIMGDMHNLLVAKQKDYGTKNIMEFSHIGIIVRMFDKVSRLINLLSKSHSLQSSVGVNSVPNESVIDTLMDLIGYSTIGLMIADSDDTYGCKFLVPMK